MQYFLDTAVVQKIYLTAQKNHQLD